MAKNLSHTKALSLKEYKKLSATRALPLHQNTLSIPDAIAARKACRCRLPPHLAWIFRRLIRRMQFAKRRCESKTCPGYKTYGARGIQFRFSSVEKSALWVWENLPHPTYDNLEIDRKDNDGHYQPGNLKLSTRRENANNRYTTFWIPLGSTKLAMQDFKRSYPECGYSRDQIKALVERGMNGEQIIERFKAGRWKTTGQYKRGPRGKYKPETKLRKKRVSTTS